MTNIEKSKIQLLQKKGYGYKRIAAEIGLPVNSVKTYCRRHPVEIATDPALSGCEHCGKEIQQPPHRKTKRFCSDACRMAWWKEHPDQIDRVASFSYICPECGIRFTSRNRGRIYCSRACYAQARKKETV